MTSAFTLLPLWNRQQEWRYRLAMVEAAQSFLYLSTFYIEPDVFGLEMLRALQSAQQRGVAVTLLIDSFGQRLGGVLLTESERRTLENEFALLRAAGGRVLFYAPQRITQRMLGGGHHIKVQVSDAGEAIFGSSNITRSSFAGWNEFSVALRGPVVTELLQTLEALDVPVSPGHYAAIARPVARGGKAIELEYWYYNPNHGQGLLGPLLWRGQNSLTERMIELVDAARQSLSLTSFYFKPTRRLMKAVLRAAHRGVSIEVFHSHRNALASTDLAWIAAATGYKRLLKAGVQIYENRHGEHSKIVLVDGKLVAFGSYNFEDAAHDRLAEAMIMTHDPRAVTAAQCIFTELRVHPDNERVTLHTLRRLPLTERIRIARYGRFKWWM